MPAPSNPKSYKVGPGSLVVGETGSPQEISCQITQCTVSWDFDSDDDVPVLCGGVLAGEDTESATLSGTIVQDLSDAGVIEWSWEHSGEVMPATFIPNSALGRSISGDVKVRALDVGGEVKTRPTSDFEWPFVGRPILSAAGGEPQRDAAEVLESSPDDLAAAADTGSVTGSVTGDDSAPAPAAQPEPAGV